MSKPKVFVNDFSAAVREEKLKLCLREQKDRFVINCDENTSDRAGVGVRDIRRLALDILRNILGSYASINNGINNSNQPIIEDIFKKLDQILKKCLKAPERK